jgi:hypothetical protein
MQGAAKSAVGISIFGLRHLFIYLIKPPSTAQATGHVSGANHAASADIAAGTNLD